MALPVSVIDIFRTALANAALDASDGSALDSDRARMGQTTPDADNRSTSSQE